MKAVKLWKRWSAWLCVLALTLTMTPLAAGAEAVPEKTDNAGAQNYSWYYDTPVESHLYSDGDRLVRVEYLRDSGPGNGRVVVEEYDQSFQLCASRTIPMELELWGGFFAGEDANYLIFGQSNPQEEDGREVIRVVRYSKDWQRQGQASLYGANTYIPFDAGSLRCDEYNGYLYVRTCHEMYASGDGLHHQANLTFSVRERDMTVTDAYYQVMNVSVGYVSHSFNQYILVDQEGRLVALDHGDAYPRSLVLMRYDKKAGGSTFTGGVTHLDVQTFPGAIGANATGAEAGGLAETSGGYVTAYSYDGAGNGSGVGNIYLSYTPKNSFSEGSTDIHRLTGYTESHQVSNPVLAPTGLDGGYVLWNEAGGSGEDHVLCYARYAADGSVSQTQRTEGAWLSDCQPICVDGKVIWYAAAPDERYEPTTPVFYTLDDTGLTACPAGGSAQSVTPEQPSSWARAEVDAALAAGIVPQALRSRYTQPATRAEFCALGVALYETVTGREITGRTAFQDTDDVNVEKLASLNVVGGVGDNRFDPDGLLTREQAAALLSRLAEAMGRPLAAREPGFADSGAISGWALSAVGQMQAAQIMGGVGDNRFDPAGSYTREQSIISMLRLYEAAG